MKTLVPSLVILILAIGTAYADIHMPPAADQGPTKKLSRGVANVLFGWSELSYQIAEVNHHDGNAAAASYGLARGVGRTFSRFGYGVFEILTFPFPTNKGKYTAPYLGRDHWLSAGYHEFPPELGWESKYDWSRD